VSHAA